MRELARIVIQVDRLLNPVTKRTMLLLLGLLQIVKFTIILSQPNSEEFKYWFYRCFQFPPYSWQCVTSDTVRGHVPFPMPYSLLWYAFYVPLTAGGYWTFNLTAFLIDSVSGLIVVRRTSQIYSAMWIQGSMYFLLVSPQDFLIWIFILLGRVRRVGPFFLALAIGTKFPLLPPILDAKLWNFILTNPWSLHDPLNWARYFVLGAYWSTSLAIWVFNRNMSKYEIKPVPMLVPR